MSLDQYRTAAFKQGPLIRQEYLYKPDVANGICYALLVEWMKLTPIFGADGQDPASRINTINENFKLAGNRQMMSKAAVTDTKKQDHADQIKTLWSSQASQEYAQVLTDLGKHSGVAFKFMRELAQANNLPLIIAHQGAKGRGFYLSLKFAGGGGHAIGFIPGSPSQNPKFPTNRLFDPNDGEFAFSDQEANNFIDDLWAAYANTNGGINRYILYAITQQETVQEKWEGGKLAQAALASSPVPAPGKLDAGRSAVFEGGNPSSVLPSSPQQTPGKLDPNRFANWQKKL